MNRTCRRLGQGLLLAGVLLGTGVAAWGQQSSPLQPIVPPVVQPVPKPPAQLPIAPQLPPIGAAPQAPPSLPPVSAGAPAVPKTEPSINDIAVELSAGPTNGNPTGRTEPGVSLEWITPAICRLNQMVTCTLVVKSLSTNRLHNVVIHNRLPAGARVQGSEPKADTDGELLVWHLGALEPRQEKRIDLQVVPTTKGGLACHAFVSFTGSSTTRLEVREPQLVIKAAAPKQSVVGDPAPVTLIITNPGDAAAEKVKVRAVLSEGLEYSRGQTAEFNLDNLGPGESRTVLVLCAAKATGSQTCSAVASAEPALSCGDSVAIDIVAPRVDLTVTGPALRYLERHAILNFKVSNPGSATANHVTLTEQVPLGFKVLAASGGGRHDFVSRTVVWFLGDLPAGETKEVALEVVAINPGEYHHKAVVTAARGLKAEGELVMRVEGLPALLMELVDTEDPVEVGKDTAYEIRITNTGTKTETNLQVTCTLPEGLELRGVKGAFGCAMKQEGRDLVFAPLPKLPPRADAIYRVQVRCLAAGDLRFQARVRADGLSQPVLREESTRVYGDEVDLPMRGIPK